MTALIRAKADPLLAARLLSAAPDDIVRVVLWLTEPTVSSAPPLRAATAGGYRATLIDRRRQELAFHTDTLKALERLHLNPQGGRVTTTVVVEGPAAAVEEALELPAVRNAALDREMDLIRPVND